jgi:hypothetical protein
MLSLVVPAVVSGQGVSIQAAAGTHLNVGGDNQSVAVGFSPHPRLDLLIGAERTHVPTEITAFGGTRGGTTTFFSGEIRFVPLTVNRVSPYLLGSAGRGTSRPNVNELFPDPVTNDAWLLLFFGGGVRVPLTARLSAVADVRFGFQGERDTIFLLVPVRGGIAWRF